MSAERSRPKQTVINLAKISAEAAVAGGAAGLAGVGVIIVRNHKELAHRNVILHPGVQKVLDFEQRTSGVGEPEVWAAVHREPHHGNPDATLYPFYQIARAVRWVEANPEAESTQGLVIPDYFKKLDPGVIRFPLEDVLKSGGIAEDIMREKLGDEYKEPDGYKRGELEKLFNPDPEFPRYWYKPYEKHQGEWTQDQIAEIILGDPHAPVRMPPRKRRTNGVRGVKRSNLFLYKKAANLFRAGERPDLKPPDLQTGKEAEYKKPWKEVVAGFVVPSAVIYIARALRGHHKPEDIAIAAVAGSVFNGVRFATKIGGGNEVNSIGHPGDTDGPKGLLEAELKREYCILPNEEGTYAADSSKGGFVGKAIKVLTGDEGDQSAHHKGPHRIRHTLNLHLKGLAAFADTPTGSLIEAAAKSKYVPGIEIGDGFGVPLEQRPDMPNEAVLLIQQRRREQREELIELLGSRRELPSSRLERFRSQRSMR